MADGITRRYHPLEFTKVRIADAFWAPRMEVNRKQTIAHQYQELLKTGRIAAFDRNWKPREGQEKRHIFWDSDTAKWIEAASYTLAVGPAPEIERQIDALIDLMADLQEPDGYLNSFFINEAPEDRWSNLLDDHELYCAGHLMEAAVAYFEATGKRKFLDVVCRYADYIDLVFGREEGKVRGYCGHEEVELALVRLYTATGDGRYLKLSSYFVDERGQQPSYFDLELEKRGESRSQSHLQSWDYCQAGKPLREQTKIKGHAVRAMYILSAMADLAGELGDRSLFDACNALWGNTCLQNMYVTGGVGSAAGNEGFTFDYDLPNETAYAETCASIGLAFWNHRLLQLACDGRYADVLERTLYNGVLSGVALDGKSFFYRNPLASRGGYGRSEWFGCACCPPNIARIIASIGQYVYSSSDTEAAIHLYVQSDAELNVSDIRVKLSQKTDYPWDGSVEVSVDPDSSRAFTLRLRIPDWCRSASVGVNGQAVDTSGRMDKGYLAIERTWSAGDKVTLDLAMPVERVYSHPSVRMNQGLVALQRGPVVYCIEEADNPTNVWRMFLPRSASFEVRFDPDLLGGISLLETDALRATDRGWENRLYAPEAARMESCRLKAVPYCVWANRGAGAMRVWLPEV